VTADVGKFGSYQVTFPVRRRRLLTYELLQKMTTAHLQLQEAQLMLTNPRDAFKGQSRSPNTMCNGFLLVCYSNFVSIRIVL